MPLAGWPLREAPQVNTLWPQPPGERLKVFIKYLFYKDRLNFFSFLDLFFKTTLILKFINKSARGLW